MKFPKFEPPTQEAIEAVGGRLLSTEVSASFEQIFSQLHERETIVGLFGNPMREIAAQILDGLDLPAKSSGEDTEAPALDQLQFNEWRNAVRSGLIGLIGYFAVNTDKITGQYEIQGKKYEPWKEID